MVEQAVADGARHRRADRLCHRQWRDEAAGPEFLASGTAWLASLRSPDHISPLSVAAANAINLRCEPTRPVRIIATHRTAVAAQELASRIIESLESLIIGDPSRFVLETQVEKEAPAAGTVRISTELVPESRSAKI